MLFRSIQKAEGFSAELEQKTTAQLVAVIVDTIGDSEIDEYANTLFRQWGIGQKDKNNGVLLLIALNERKSRIEVGYGLEGRLPDGKTGRIQDEYLIPYLSKGDYDNAVIATCQALAREIAAEYNITLSDVPAAQAQGSTKSEDDTSSKLFPIFVIAFFIFDLIFLKARITKFLFKDRKSVV